MAKGKKTKKALTQEEWLEQALVPKEEWPYRVPGNWCWVRLNALADLHNGDRGKNYPSKKDYQISGIPFINAGALKDGHLDENEFNFITEQKYADLRAGKIMRNDILYCLRGSLGKIAIINTDNKGAISSSLCILRVKSFVSVKYLFYILNADIIKRQQDLVANGSAQPNLSATNVMQYMVPFPPVKEQQCIIDRIENLFVKLEKAKKNLQIVVYSFEQRKSSILHKAFTGELTKQWRKSRGMGMDSWERVSLSDVCKVNPKKIETKDLPDDLEVSFFPMSALSEVYGEITNPQTKPLKEVKTGFTNFSEGDVVFAKITPCMENGKSAVIGRLVNDIGYGTTEFYVLRCSEKLHNRYLYHLVRDKHFRDEAKSVMTGAVGQQRVPKSFLEKYPLYLPSMPEQEEICRVLDEMFAKERKVKNFSENVIKQIDVIKKSILARAFRGKLGTNDPAEGSAVGILKKGWEGSE